MLCCFIPVNAKPSGQSHLVTEEKKSTKTGDFAKPELEKLSRPKKFNPLGGDNKKTKEIKKFNEEQKKKLEPEKKYEREQKSLNFGDTLDVFPSSSSMRHQFANEEEYYADYEDTDDRNSDNFASLISLIGQQPISFSGFSNTPSILPANALGLTSVSTIHPPLTYSSNSLNRRPQITSFKRTNSAIGPSTSSYSVPPSQNLGSIKLANKFAKEKNTNFGNKFARTSSTSSSYGVPPPRASHSNSGPPSASYGTPPKEQKTTHHRTLDKPTTRYSAPSRPNLPKPKSKPHVFNISPRSKPKTSYQVQNPDSNQVSL